MKDLFESLLYFGGSILVWGKIGSILLVVLLLSYTGYKINKFLRRHIAISKLVTKNI